MWVGKPNLVKDFCPRLPLDLDFGLGQAFQLQSFLMFLKIHNLVKLLLSLEKGELSYFPIQKLCKILNQSTQNFCFITLINAFLTILLI